jgi:uncharacterized protein YbcC (UPF0753/DUF2309 family)
MSPKASLSEAELARALNVATRKIAPVWPLESFVAVNPYLGLVGQDFDSAAAVLRRVAGARMALPLSAYLEALREGRITSADVEHALARAGESVSAAAFLVTAHALAARPSAPSPSVPTVADVAARWSGHDWPRFATERVSAWAAAHFDNGQAAWRPGCEPRALYAAWRAEAELDRTPEVMGIPGFRRHVARLPAEPITAAAYALNRLSVPESGLDLYLHRVLLRVSGWSAFAARVVWDSRLHQDREDDTLLQFLAVLLSWEVALLESFAAEGLADAWDTSKRALSEQKGAAPAEDPELGCALVLQTAYELAEQRRISAKFEERSREQPSAKPSAGSSRPSVQAVFCIDVRSEVFRRHLEAQDASIETLGFAGFFGFPIEYVALGESQGVQQCPVLLKSAHRVVETLAQAPEVEPALHGRRIAQEVERAWQGFKMGAVTCFSFVGPIGLAYLPKLVTDAFGLTRPTPAPMAVGFSEATLATREVCLDHAEHGAHANHGTSGISLPARVELAFGALTAMSLTDDFARLVLLVGHGSTSVNNPHATGLDCGACGGRTGEANARVAARVLNDLRVREGLAARGIIIPKDTVFVAAQHDTTQDTVQLFERHTLPASHQDDLARVEEWFALAGQGARAERAPRLGVAAEEDAHAALFARSRDWAQVRPEWGLAGCAAFIVAPRERTQGLDLAGRSFLHSYAWERDTDFGVLELIMTAPMVVASWISLQYYASSVDPELFGSGNKTLHNVVGTVGVLEGNAGDLRVGLPWQSVHDGQRLQHEPLRLNVFIEAPIEAMNAIIAKHESVRHLVDNGWLHLFALDSQGRVQSRYEGNLTWAPLPNRELSQAA